MFPGGKGGRCLGLTTLHLHVPIALKSGNLKLLEPSGPVRACNGIAFLFIYLFICLFIYFILFYFILFYFILFVI